jgi:biopolymer transport protein ExbD
MSFSFDNEAVDVINEINMTPLVDVMLVLLIVFIVTVPVMKQSVGVDLPRANAPSAIHQPDALQLSISANGDYRLDGLPVSPATLNERLAAAAARSPQPALHLHGDKAVRYEHVAQAMAAARQAGLLRVGLMTLTQP